MTVNLDIIALPIWPLGAWMMWRKGGGWRRMSWTRRICWLAWIVCDGCAYLPEPIGHIGGWAAFGFGMIFLIDDSDWPGGLRRRLTKLLEVHRRLAWGVPAKRPVPA